MQVYHLEERNLNLIPFFNSIHPFDRKL